MAELPLSERILCSSWQPVQVGASCEPAATAWPWTLCFQSRAQLDEFLRALKLPLDQKYIEGQKLAKKIGVTITPDTGGFGNIRQPDPKWAKLSMEV